MSANGERPSRIHHIDPRDRSKCSACGDEWPCVTFLLTVAVPREQGPVS